MSHWRDVLVCTVGTSLKTNLEKSEEAGIRSALEQKNVKGLSLELLNQSPEDRLCGAEINSITSIIKQGHLNNKRRLVYLVSDTEDGKFLGQVLTQYYENHNNPYQFQKVEFHPLEGLADATPKRFRTEGLRNLVRAIAQVVNEEGSETMVINATGGYKAQIAFAGMIGQALEIPVCYLFERFSEVIELPPQPISLDLSFWLENVDQFYDLADNEARENPSQRDHRFATLVDAIDINGQTVIGLSPVGQLFHETFRHRFKIQRQRILPPASGIAPEEKAIKYEDQNSKKHSGLSYYLGRIRKVPYVNRLYTHYYNPGLPGKNYFRKSATGEVSQIEGGYSDGKALTKFDVVTTAATSAQRDAALADLREQLQTKKWG